MNMIHPHCGCRFVSQAEVSILEIAATKNPATRNWQQQITRKRINSFQRPLVKLIHKETNTSWSC